MWATDISPKQYSDFVAIERVCSILSFLASVFIIFTFSSSEDFRKPITRLVFYASFGNLFTNVGTLMARTFVGVPASVGCQLQAFLIQTLMQADAFWTLAMAINVHLTFYRKYDAEKLRRMDALYLCTCYGVPFIVAFCYVFVYTPARGKIYGDAVLWCWIAPSWNIWRIATFYAPVWVAIFITLFIYARTGRQIYRKYKQLKSPALVSVDGAPAPFIIMEPFSTRTTEVYITSEIIPNTPISRHAVENDASSSGVWPTPVASCSVTISSDARPQSAFSSTKRGHGDIGRVESVLLEMKRLRAHPDTASSIFTSSSRGRLSSYNSSQEPTTCLSGSLVPRLQRQLAIYDASNAAWSYAKCAMLFFIAMLITWIPSTVNRVYSLVQNGEVSLELQYAAAFVLPLQGFWNAMIYILITNKACSRLLERCIHLITMKMPVSADELPRRESYQPGLDSRFGSISNTLTRND